MKLIAKEILFCKVCDSLYTEENKPFILNCGNSLCHNCVLKYTRVVLDKSDPSCHFDYSHHHILEEVPVNYVYLNIIQNFKNQFMKKEKLTENQLDSYFKKNIISPNNQQTESNNFNVLDTDCLNFNTNINEYDCSFIQGIDMKNKLQMNGYWEVQCDNYSYKGNYKNGLMNGDGEYSCSEFVYVGKFEKDIPSGQGLLILNTSEGKTKYCGIFNGFRNGEGEILYSNGEKFLGKWKNLKREGIGKMISPEGDFFEGEFRNDSFDGRGVYYCKAERKKTEGNWKDGKEDGEMLIYFDNMVKPMKMLFRSGVLVTILEL